MVKTYKIHELKEDVIYKDSKHGMRYKIVGDRLLCNFSKSAKGWQESVNSYNLVLDMEFIECDFKPEVGQIYYYPVVDINIGCEWSIYIDVSIDRRLERLGLIFRTRDQAIEKAKELGWVEC